MVAEVSFDIERTLYGAQGRADAELQHVFVTGLARAGTTILMRQLYGTGAFRSLTYRDMPFVLAPNLWSNITSVSRQDMHAVERSHGDGILVDFDSPEALEEVFWRVICGPEYIRADRLVPMSADQDAEEAFRTYVSLLLRQHAGKRYLSKNNNNILRLRSLSSCFPSAIIIIPFRDPFQHAHSLMRQHLLFRKRHREDPFSRDYMTWLAHHEFGQDHRPFVFDDARFAAGNRRNPEAELAYWVQLWVDTYEFIDATAPTQAVFLSYEQLCGDTEAIWSSLCRELGLPLRRPSEPLHLSKSEPDGKIPDDLLDRAQTLYSMLRMREFRE